MNFLDHLKVRVAALRVLLLSLLALLALLGAAYAIQPGTTGTDKTAQQMALRQFVLTQPNTTGTSSAGAVTVAASGSGKITTESVNTAAAGTYALAITNPLVEAGDIGLCAFAQGTNSAGTPLATFTTVAAGVLTCRIYNGHATNAFNGTFVVSYLIIKQSALGSD